MGLHGPSMSIAPDYLNPSLPANLRRVRIPIVEATDKTLEGYGFLFDDPERLQVEIVRWPAQGWRPVDLDSGDEGGVKSGIFYSQWNGDVLYGKNDAVGGHYILGYACEPSEASESNPNTPDKVLLWHANYHPDGGQGFFPLDNGPFVVPLALPGDNIRPESFKCFYFHGDRGLYIHPDIWHEGVFTCDGYQRFYDVQGAVHARISVNFAEEFGCLLEAPLLLNEPQ